MSKTPNNFNPKTYCFTASSFLCQPVPLPGEVAIHNADANVAAYPVSDRSCRFVRLDLSVSPQREGSFWGVEGQDHRSSQLVVCTQFSLHLKGPHPFPSLGWTEIKWQHALGSVGGLGRIINDQTSKPYPKYC